MNVKIRLCGKLERLSPRRLFAKTSQDVCTGAVVACGLHQEVSTNKCQTSYCDQNVDLYICEVFSIHMISKCMREAVVLTLHHFHIILRENPRIPNEQP
jgi:hypothetical protein